MKCIVAKRCERSRSLFLYPVIHWLAFVDDMNGYELDRLVPDDFEASVRYITKIHDRRSAGNRECRFPRYLHHAAFNNVSRLDPVMEMRRQFITRLIFAERKDYFHAWRAGEVHTTQFFSPSGVLRQNGSGSDG